MSRPSLSGSGKTPMVTVRLPEAVRDDARWAATVMGTDMSAVMREAVVALILRAEAASGEPRPSKRQT